MKTPRLRRRSGTTAKLPVQPVSVPVPVPAPEPVQSQPVPRTTRRAARTVRRAAERAVRDERRANDQEARDERRTAKKAAKTTQHNAKVTRRRVARRNLRNRLESKLREKASEPASLTPDARAGLMGVSRRGALVAITLLDLAATAVSFGESWDALYQWATRHGLSGFWAFAFPLQIDTFIAMGELALFIAIIDHWHWRSRVWAWVSTFGGLALSLVGNVGHVTGHPSSWQATAAVPPFAAMAGMFIGFQVLKRVMNPTKAASLDQEHLEIISQLRSQVEELSRQPEPAHVPAQRPASEPGQFYTEDRPEPVTAFDLSQWEPSGYLDDVVKEGQQTPPTPRTSTGQDKPTIVKEDVLEMLKGVAKPDPAPRRKRGQKHPKWDDGVQAYRDSGATKEERYSQRELATKLGMQNRALAARIIDHVENGGE